MSTPTEPGRRRVAARRRTAVATAMLGVVVTAMTSAPAAPVAADTDPPLRLIDQAFVLQPDGTLEITTQLDGSADVDGIVADGTVIVTSHRPLTTRSQVWNARDGSLPNVVDTIDISPRAELTPPTPPAVAGEPAGAEAVVTSTGLLTVRVPTESTRRTPDALQFAQPGIHPVVIEVRHGDSTEGVLVTFVDRQATAGDTAGSTDEALGMGVVIAPSAAPTVATDGDVSLGPSALAALGRLADTLDAVATALGDDAATSLPVLVEVDPSSLVALADTDAGLAAELAQLLGRVDLVATPRFPLDPSSAAAAGQQLVYARILDDGAAVLADTTTTTPVRTTAIASRPLSRGGGELLVATGADVVVLTYDGYESLDGALGLFTDTTLAVEMADLGLRASIIDPYLAQQLAEPGDDTAATAVAVAAEIVLIAEQISRVDDLAGHALLLGSTDLAPADARVLGRIITLLADHGAVRLGSPAQLVTTLETMEVDGAPVVVGLPDEVAAPPGYDPVVRGTLVGTLRANTAAVASMLPDDDPRRGEWATAADQLMSTVVDDDLAADTDQAVRTDLDAVRQCVVPPERFSFTLTGRTSTIPFQIGNRCDVPLTVRVQLDSPKISFPDGEQLVVLAAGADTEVRVEAVARTNGRSSVFLRLLTPTPSGTEQAVAPEVVLTARVQSLAGIGQLLLGTLVLVVVAWWLRQWREARRQATLATNARHHPAGRADR